MQLVEWALGGRSWKAPSLFVSPRMGGGPRTFPGGVSKWQWKRMQEKKNKQILKARLVRERQLYEMRKRAELKAVELEKPWEMTRTTRAPTLFAVTADDQLQAMADRFVKRGAIDMWTDKDGPHSQSAAFLTQEGKPSARLFPRNALYSTQPYALASPPPSPRNHNGHSSNHSPSPSPPPPPSHSRNSMSRRGKSIVSRSISVLSSMSGQGNYSDAHITKENHKQESVKDKRRQRRRFLASPEPPHADGQNYSNKTKSSVPKGAVHTFAGFNLAKRSMERLREASYKSKTDVDSTPQ